MLISYTIPLRSYRTTSFTLSNLSFTPLYTPSTTLSVSLLTPCNLSQHSPYIPGDTHAPKPTCASLPSPPLLPFQLDFLATPVDPACLYTHLRTPPVVPQSCVVTRTILLPCSDTRTLHLAFTCNFHSTSALHAFINTLPLSLPTHNVPTNTHHSSRQAQGQGSPQS